MKKNQQKRRLKAWIETYGCQMNQCDSEIVAGILKAHEIDLAPTLDDADIALINTCSVRDHAEQRALGRASVLAGWKRQQPGRQLGLLGCMAQRLGQELLTEKPFLDFIIGPDEYRKLPDLLRHLTESPTATDFHEEELYSAIQPLRETKISGWVTITRGCDNFCAYCIVPHVRGRERSRPAQEILKEIEAMGRQGFREVTLLGQNVNSYHDGHTDFPELLARAGAVDTIDRIRFTTSHPKDLSDQVLEVMANSARICSHLHLPAQSGSDRILAAMNRKYTRDDYLNIIAKARTLMPEIGLTTDILVGFPGETENDFKETLSLMRQVRYDDAFMYRYSPREGTRAATMDHQVPEIERLRRLDELIQLQREISLEQRKRLIGQTHPVLAEAESKKSQSEWLGRTDTNMMVVFPKQNSHVGETVQVEIETCQGATLRGKIVETE